MIIWDYHVILCICGFPFVKIRIVSACQVRARQQKRAVAGGEQAATWQLLADLL
jgi:hypothetical protein